MYYVLEPGKDLELRNEVPSSPRIREILGGAFGVAYGIEHLGQYHPSRIVFIGDDDAIGKGLPFNAWRWEPGRDPMHGAIVICGRGPNPAARLLPLTREQIERVAVIAPPHTEPDAGRILTIRPPGN